MQYSKWALVTIFAASGCTKGGAPSHEIRLPKAGEHITLEEVLGCKSADAEISVNTWNHWNHKTRPVSEAESEVREEFRTYITLPEAEYEIISRNVSLLGYSGKGTMRCPQRTQAQWIQQSTFLYVHIGDPKDKKPLVLKLAPREWLKILDEVKRRQGVPN